MKYALLNENGNQIQWVNDLTIKELPANAKVLTDDEWENRHNKPESAANKKNRIKNQLIAVRKSYLLSTDWYICREADEPNSYPQEIKTKRIEARQEINDIQNASTLTALNQFSLTFE